VLALVASGFHICWPRKADLRAFDPAGMARLETAMDDAVLRESGVARAEAMAYRDARGRAMTAEDWAAIETQLLLACQLLKAAVQGA
jgi:hypothetical protein